MHGVGSIYFCQHLMVLRFFLTYFKMYRVDVLRYMTGKKPNVVFTKEFETRGEAKDYYEDYNKSVFHNAYLRNPDFYFVAVYVGGKVFDLYGDKHGR